MSMNLNNDYAVNSLPTSRTYPTVNKKEVSEKPENSLSNTILSTYETKNSAVTKRFSPRTNTYDTIKKLFTNVLKQIKRTNTSVTKQINGIDLKEYIFTLISSDQRAMEQALMQLNQPTLIYLLSVQEDVNDFFSELLRQGHAEGMKYLLSQCKEVLQGSLHAILFFDSMKCNCAEILRLVWSLLSPASKDEVFSNKSGLTPLHSGFTPLHIAALNGYTEAIKAISSLIGMEELKNALLKPDDNNRIPLALALRPGNVETITLLGDLYDTSLGSGLTPNTTCLQELVNSTHFAVHGIHREAAVPKLDFSSDLARTKYDLNLTDS